MKVCFYIDTAYGRSSSNLNIFFNYIINNSDILPILVFETKSIKTEYFNLIESDIEFEYKILEEFNNVKSFFSNFLLIKKIDNLVYFNGTCEVYRPNKILEFSKFIKEHNIKFYWINNTFLKGRFAIFEDVVFKNSKILYDYNNIYNKKLFLNKTKSLNNFIRRYWEYKNLYHFAGDFYKEKFNLNKYFNKNFIINILIRIYFKKKILTNKLPKHNDKKIILILLSKQNHWFNKYANTEIKIKNLIKSFTDNLPKDCLLFFKTHPKDKIPLWLLRQLDNRSFLYSGPFLPAIKFSELIICTGTTSGFEAMTLRKKIIHIGKNSYLNNIYGPMQIVDNLLDLKNKSIELLNSEIPHEKIDSYLLSLIKNSFPQMKTHKDSFKYDRDITFVIKAAKKLINNF